MTQKLFLLIFLLFSLNSFAQYFNEGQDRSGLKWKKIESIHFEVIFPEGYEKQGERVVKLMEKSYQYTTKTLKHKPKKISVILHAETVKSNAFLGWAPSRIEMYATPHQNIYAQDWLEQLAIHEYRHMVQVSKLEAEMPQLLRWLFGEQAAAFLTAAYLPFWFIEGDAVVAETALSNSGRGRLPEFHRELKAQLVDKDLYPYEKAYLGSFKDHVANHYKMGYFMVGGAQTIFDKPVWEEVVHHVARKPYSIIPFDRGLKKSIGLNKIQLYDTVFKHLQHQWKAEDILCNPTAFSVHSKTNKYHTNYNYGFKSNDSTYIALKTGQAEIGQFVAFAENGKENVIYTPGYSLSESVHGREEFIVWTERLTAPRWHHSDKSLLRILNVETNELKEFKFNSKLFAPSISPDKSKIVTVEADNNYQFYLTIINTENGEIIKQISTADEDDFLITPSWSEDGQSILAVVLRDNQKGIVKLNIKSETEMIVFPFDSHEISQPVEFNNTLYFIGGFTGNDNLYKLNETGNLFKIVESRFGLTHHSFYNKQLIFSNYTADGYQIVSLPVDSIQSNAFQPEQIPTNYPIADKIADQEAGVINFSDLDKIKYSTEKYKKGEHLLNFHSWAPVAIDPYGQSANLGASLMSQNMLSTANFVAGYRYRWQDQQGEMFANFRYLGWYPVLEADISSGKRNSHYFQLQSYVNDENEIVRVDTLKKDFSWQANNVMLNTYLPLNFSKGKYYKRIQPRLTYLYSFVDADKRAYTKFPDGAYQSLETGIYLYQIMKSAEQDLVPDFGILFDLSFKKSLSAPLNYGSMFAISTVLYLPGIKHNHGFTIYNGYQTKGSTAYTFSDRVRFPRGHSHLPNNELYSFGIDYQLPLFYSDMSLINLVYLKRFNLKLFYDHAIYQTVLINDNFTSVFSGDARSTGFELTADAHFLRFIAPIEVGFRTSYLFDQNFKFDYLFNIAFTF